MPVLPSQEEQEALLAALGEVVAARGAASRGLGEAYGRVSSARCRAPRAPIRSKAAPRTFFTGPRWVGYQ